MLLHQHAWTSVEPTLLLLFVAALTWNACLLLPLDSSAFLAAAAGSLVGRLRMDWQRCALSRMMASLALLRLRILALVVR